MVAPLQLERMMSMGSAAAMNSIDRVLNKHGDEIIEKLRKEINNAPEVAEIYLENRTYSIGVLYKLQSGTYIEGRPISIEELAEEYPDCDVGW